MTQKLFFLIYLACKSVTDLIMNFGTLTKIRASRNSLTFQEIQQVKKKNLLFLSNTQESSKIHLHDFQNS